MKAQTSYLSIVRILSVFAIVIASIIFLTHHLAATAVETFRVKAQAEPWTDTQTVKPAELVREIADAKGADKPVVVCSGVRVLYEGAHVPGAVYHGPAVKPEGLDDLKKWAQAIPRSSNVVVYCGCCPFDHCPNIRPAFEALRQLGFQRLRVLVLPNDFAKDWVEQGYRYEKGKG